MSRKEQKHKTAVLNEELHVQREREKPRERRKQRENKERSRGRKK